MTRTDRILLRILKTEKDRLILLIGILNDSIEFEPLSDLIKLRKEASDFLQSHEISDPGYIEQIRAFADREKELQILIEQDRDILGMTRQRDEASLDLDAVNSEIWLIENMRSKKYDVQKDV